MTGPVDSVVVQRDPRTALSTPGTLRVNNTFACYTLEPLHPIEPGIYRARIVLSQKFSALEGRPVFTPRLYGVPGFPLDDVEIHFGNFPRDTDGCTLVGTTRATDFVGNSRIAFAELMSVLPEQFNVEYRLADPGF